jgi:hypothetical protein
LQLQFGILISLPVVMLAYDILAGDGSLANAPDRRFIFAFIPIIVVTTILGIASRREHMLIKKLGESGSVEAIGPLANALRVPGVDRDRVITALGRALDSCKSSDPATLQSYFGEGDSDAIYRALEFASFRREAEVLLLLGAIERLRDPKALPYLDRMIKKLEKAGESVRQSEMHNAAQRCKLTLETAKQAAERDQHLLRAVSHEEGLLRPAQGDNSAGESLLLRSNMPSSGEHEESL